MRAESIRTTTELLRQADAVLVGAGSGLSSAAGYNHYHHNTVFEENFHDFEKAYGIQSLFRVLLRLLKAGTAVGFLLTLYKIYGRSTCGSAVH